MKRVTIRHTQVTLTDPTSHIVLADDEMILSAHESGLWVYVLVAKTEDV